MVLRWTVITYFKSLAINWTQISKEIKIVVLCLGVVLLSELKAVEIDVRELEEPLRSVLDSALTDVRESEGESSSNNESALGRLGMLLQAHNLYAPAIEAYTAAIEIGADPRWLYLRAICSMELGMSEDATHDLARVVQVEDSVATIWYRLGVAYLRLGKVDDARSALNQANQLEPSEAATLIALAEVHELVGELEEAIQLLTAAFELDPNSGQIAYRLSQLERRTGNEKASESWLAQRVNQLAPQIEDPLLLQVASMSMNPTFFISASKRAWERGDHDTAVLAFTRALELAPTDENNLLEFARLLINLQRWEAAQIHLEDSRSTLESSAEYWYLHALLMALTGRQNQALSSINLSLGLETSQKSIDLQKQIEDELLQSE